MIGTINQFLFFANVILWSVLIGAFVIVKVKNSVTRRKYSKKQENEVAQEYHSSGLHQFPGNPLGGAAPNINRPVVSKELGMCGAVFNNINIHSRVGCPRPGFERSGVSGMNQYHARHQAPPNKHLAWRGHPVEDKE